MARRRLNTKFLIILLVIVIAGVAGAIGVREYQIRRNAPVFLERAKACIEEGDLRKARENLINYLGHRPDDDTARTLLANTCLDVTDQTDADQQDYAYAFKILPEAVRRMPENDEVRYRYATFMMRPTIARYPEALRQLEILSKKDSKNTDYQVNKLRCLIRLENYDGEDGAISYGYQLIGYDEAKNAFDPSKGTAASRVEVYSMLANLMVGVQRKPEHGEEIINQMVKANPKDEVAYLSRCHFFLDSARRAEEKKDTELAQEKKEAARSDIDKALELNPTNADVLLTAGQIAEEDKDFDRARQMYERGIENHPKESRFYDSYAILENQQNNYSAAIAKFDEGIAALEIPIDLMIKKALIQGANGDVEGMRETQKTLLTSYILPQDIKDFVEANALFAEKKWTSAAKILENLRTRLEGNRPGLFRSVDVNLGKCYEFLGKYEQALNSYDLALKSNPDNRDLRLLADRMRVKLGRASTSSQLGLGDLTNAELSKPEAERNWSKVDQLIEQTIKKQNLDSANTKLLQAEALTLRGEYAKAEKLIREANAEKPDDLTVWNAAFRLTIRNPDGGPEKALKIHENIVKKFGDSPSLREWKARAYLLLGGDDMQANLEQLTQGIDDWPNYDQVLLWKFLGNLYMQVGMTDNAQKCMKQASILSPEDLETRVSLFEIALIQLDEEAIKEAQEEILKAVKDKNDSTYLFTEAAKILALTQNTSPDSPDIETARQLIEKALLDRPEWHLLYRLKARIASLQGREDDAIDAYERAANLGPPHPSAVLNHANLLYNRGRLREAAFVINQIDKELRIKVLGRLNAEIMYQTGNIPEAIETADALIKAHPENPGIYLWYGQLLLRMDELQASDEHHSKAEEMLSKAVQLEPQSPHVWLAWISHLINSKRRADAEQALREAQLALPADTLPIVVARCNEILGRWHDAESYYLAAYKNDLDNSRMARSVAAFYLGPGYRRADRITKATPYINQILQAAADGKIASDHEDVLWARREAATILSLDKTYPSLLKAEQLLEANAVGKELRIHDKLQLAQILQSRPEPASRLRAIELLQDVGSNQELNLAAQLSLAKLYNQVGQWPKAREQMLGMIGRFGDQSIVWETYVKMLIDHREYKEAESMLERLIKIQPDNSKSLSVIQLLIQVLSGQDKKEQAVNWLQSQLPKDMDSLGAEHLDTIRTYANLFNLIGEPKTAETLLRQHLAIAQKSEDPAKTNESAFLLASQLAQYGDVEDAMNLLDKMFSQSKSPQVLNIALSLLSQRRDLIGSTKDATVENWLNRALQEEPESISLLSLMARFREIQNNHKEAESIYRQLLRRQEVQGEHRGILLNNLAFLLALQKKDLDDASRFVEEGIKLFGPTAEMLDTRAVVKIARKDTSGAIEDLKLALLDKPTASQYFHLAQAYLLAGDKQLATDAWNKGKELDLGPKSLSDLEHEEYERIRKEIGQNRIPGTG